MPPSDGEPLTQLKTIGFVYDTREDRIRAAVNGSGPDSWSCWITRRLSLAWLAKAGDFLVTTSPLAQRAAPEHRGDLATFEHDAAMAQTARAMTPTPPEVIETAPADTALLDKVTWTPRGERYQFELVDNRGTNAVGALTRPELQRIMQMLQEVVAKAGWAQPTPTQQSTVDQAAPPSPVRH